ncbi:helix-turn-helix domain-containing protein [Actinacidiphila glaucinigra]|uniref:helix-turn-helix domain-containing protein n=1 Tax=Actinacidiphila glaucinigra TaxID=235986 RepID=UPI0037983CB0
MQSTPDRSGPAAGGSSDGDCGAGRIAVRREQLGISREELAFRAGMSMAYLGQVEELGTGFDPAALMRLAVVPGVSCEDLTEGFREAPPGQGGPAARPVLQRLPEQECWKRWAPTARSRRLHGRLGG